MLQHTSQVEVNLRVLWHVLQTNLGMKIKNQMTKARQRELHEFQVNSVKHESNKENTL